MTDRRYDVLRHFPALLERWRGAGAQLGEMTQSHRTLRLFLRFPRGSGFLLISCIDPQHIQAPIAWESADIQIAADDADGYFVSDAAVGVRIRTGGVEVREYD